MNKLPLVKISDMTFEESYYDEWSANALLKAVKEQNCVAFDIPLAALDIKRSGFESYTMKSFIFQMKRVNDSDLKYPIILNDHGECVDGNHRICKAILEGHETIKAYRLEKMPAKDKRPESD